VAVAIAAVVILVILVVLVVAVVLGGCVDRRYLLTSYPPGAFVLRTCERWSPSTRIFAFIIESTRSWATSLAAERGSTVRQSKVLFFMDGG